MPSPPPICHADAAAIPTPPRRPRCSRASSSASGTRPAAASEPLRRLERHAPLAEGEREAKALVTYRRSDGLVRHVLIWGALNARAPSAEIPQVRFKWDYAGGWGKYRNGEVLASVRERLPDRMTARRSRCSSRRARRRTAPTGRSRPGSGDCRSSASIPWLPAQTAWELHVAHWSGPLPVLELYRNWTYGGKWQGVFGRYTYLGQPVYGFGATAKGVPKDKYGRNLYVDTFDSAYGPGWKREAGILTHNPTGTFCHSFVPQRPFASTRATISARPRPASAIASLSEGRA